MRENGDLYYLLSDHLGSTSMTLDSSGNRVAEMRFLPWGESRYTWGTAMTDFTYTGQRSRADSFGLMYYNARWYDPSHNQFGQPDSIISDLYNPLDYNRYSYVRYNPLKYIDPSGHSPWYIAGWDDSYRQRQRGNTCAVVSSAVAVSILTGHKVTQKDIQWRYPLTHGGIGVHPRDQDDGINVLYPNLEATYSQGSRADLMNNLQNDLPTIVSLALPASVNGKPVYGHAIVAIGFDPTTGDIQFFNPANKLKMTESDIYSMYNDMWVKEEGISFRDFSDLWSQKNVFIPANSMVTVEQARPVGIVGGGGDTKANNLYY